MLNRTGYTLLASLLAPVAVARLLLLGRKHPGYRQNIGQRFGRVDFVAEGTHSLWLHAVSVGEVIASEPFVNRLLSEYPDFSICVTNTTPTGAEQVARSFGHWGERVHQSFAPYDLPASIERFLDQLRPVGLVMMETELWPNWLAAVHARGIPSLLVNARMSDKSLRGYRKLGNLGRDMMAQLTQVSAQTEADAERFRQLGASCVDVTGNLKFEFELDEAQRRQSHELAESLALPDAGQVIVAASTHAGEEALIVQAFARLREQNTAMRLLLVPRHPDRAGEVSALLAKASLGYRLRSGEQPLDARHPVLVCDKLGELRAIYGLGEIALMGGTLVEHGGHNPLEPAAWGAALVAGPSQRNFDQMFAELESAGAMRRVRPDVEDIVQVLAKLLEDAGQRQAMGAAALDYLQRNRGACAANMALFRRHISAHLL